MASTGDNSDRSSLDSSSSSLSPLADEGAETDGNHSEETQHNQPNLNQEAEPASSEEDDDEDEDSDEYDRENRFQGPPSTWRYFTEDERSLSHSLDQQRNNNLGIALYNVHAMKTRLRDPQAAANVKSYHSKKKWIKPNEDGTLPWIRPVRWTAWPLKPGKVPRSGERFGVRQIPDGFEGETYKKTEPWKASGELIGEILAIAMRKAKERLHASGRRDRSTSVEETKGAKKPSKEDANGSADDGSDADFSMDNLSDDSVEVLSVRPRKDIAPPVPLDENILVDDDTARALLQPKIRHVLSQLDGLLTGLHKSRQGQTRSNSRSRPRTRRSRSTSKVAKSSSRSKWRRRTPSKANSDEASDHDEAEGDEEGEPDNNRRRKRRRRLNPRDWSEVLGMAAITGWDPKVVDRASKRCAALFEEGMDFKTVPLHSMDSTDSNARPHRSSVVATTTVPDVDDFIVDDKPATNWCYCPFTTCARHDQPFEQAWRWREHMKRSHKYENARIERLEAELRERDGAALSSVGQRQGKETKDHDLLLQPIDVKMARGRDKLPRKGKGKASDPVVIESDEEEGEDAEMEG